MGQVIPWKIKWSRGGEGGTSGSLPVKDSWELIGRVSTAGGTNRDTKSRPQPAQRYVLPIW